MTPTHIRLTRALVLAASVATLVAPATALGGSTAGKPATSRQLSPADRIALQEDARRNDPAIYGGTWVAGYPGPGAAKALTPAERIALQEDARLHDPAIYGGTWAPGFPTPTRPTIDVVVASGGFHWIDAGLGAGAAVAVAVVAVGATIIARTGRLAKA